MKKITSVLQLMLGLIIAAAIFSCGGSATKSAGDTTKKDTTVKAAAPPAMQVPFDIVQIATTVKDYTKWRPFFNADSPFRKAAGLQDLAVEREIDNPNNILVVFKASDINKAKAFAADPRLKAKMDSSGVVSKPDIEYYHIIRVNMNTHEKQAVIITHRVKDFAAWLKVYDAEGMAKRASEGTVDVALGRGIVDSNMVYLVFDITDMAKAKASIFSDEKKKLMMSAGVIGKPVITFYKDGE